MKLNQKQKYALFGWMIERDLSDKYTMINDFDDFCNEEIKEWRVTAKYGLAGKIWNFDDRIYITGYSPNEVSKSTYKKQQKEIDILNKEINQILEIYK